MGDTFFGLKLVGKIEENFKVPSYQRGYRWRKKHVKQLLKDIYDNGDKAYCLQPIVVCKKKSECLLIDGQQRITTIYLIYKYLNKKIPTMYKGPKFTISYDTRQASGEFLEKIESIEDTEKNEYIDFWFMKEAYDAIEEWFSSKELRAITDIGSYLETNVSVLWYEIEEEDEEKGIKLFERLNIGKIPLTSAELIRAMLLKGGNESFNSIKSQEEFSEIENKNKVKAEIALQWDNIERELNNDSMWGFLTNPKSEYQTHIDLILDLYVEKPENEKDLYFSFFEFLKKTEGNNISDIWNEIVMIYLKLKDWYDDPNLDLYHKIGFLITSGSQTLREIYNLSKGKTKSDFEECLDEKIAESIRIEKSYTELNYDDDYDALYKLLLLFNVESIRNSKDSSQRFPFEKFKTEKGKRNWSLEHIHARRSEGLSTEAAYREWIKSHIASLKRVKADSPVLLEAEEAYESKRITGKVFSELYEKIVQVLSPDGEDVENNSLNNLAILQRGDNAALSNSTFDVKRDKIIEIDKEGKYIPFCTKMVFLKYYIDSDEHQIHFWGKEDRIAYIKEMNRVLEKYLDEEIIFA